MNREEFISRLYNIHSLTNEQIDQILDISIEEGGLSIKRVIAIEEMSELTKEISKEIRGEGTRMGLLEEMADALLAIRQLQMVYKFPDDSLRKAISVKAERIKNGGN